VDFAFAERPARIDADKLKNHLRRLKDLATLPGVVHRVLGLLQNPHVEMLEVAGVIEGDPAISIRLLRLVNSAFFGLSTKVSSVHKALITLGVKNVQKIIITASILEKFKGISQQDAEEYWRHSLLTSRWTKRLLELQLQRGEILEDGGMAGLLHDTGRLAIWQFFAEANAEVQKLVKGGRNAEEAEREVLSMPHSEIGAFLFQIWNFPAHLLQASCYHHTPFEELGRVKDLQPTTPFVSAACRLAHLPMAAGEDGTERLDTSSLEPEFVAFHRLNLDALVESAPKVLKEAGEMLANFVSQAKSE
jgi:HD-like signal output (HDOD) protein